VASERSIRLIWLGGALLFALAMDAVAFGPQYAWRSPPLGIDFRVFWEAAAASPERVYSPSLQPFVNPPTALLFLKPLAVIPYEAAFALWTALSCAAFYFAARRSFPRPAVLLSFLSPVIVWALILGQMSLLLASLLLIGFTVEGLAGGALIVAAIAIKPQIGFLAPIAIIAANDWRRLTGFIVGGLALLLCSIAISGPSLWLTWFRALPMFREALTHHHIANKAASPTGFAEGLGLNPLPVLLLSVIAGMALAYLAGRRLRGGQLAGAVSAASVLAAPYAMRHDLAALVPLALSVPVSVAIAPAFLVFVGFFMPFSSPLLVGLFMARPTYRGARLEGYPAGPTSTRDSLQPSVGR
jgi:hypothetical protein